MGNDTSRSRGGFNVVAYFRCLLDGHDYRNSRTFPGRKTCMHCRLRTKS